MQRAHLRSQSLYDTLEEKGWVWQNSHLYAPHKTFWLEGAKEQVLPYPMLVNMYQRMKGTFEQLLRNPLSHLSPEQYGDLVQDIESLVSTLQELVSEKRSEL